MDEDHHLSNVVSPLIDLGLGLVSQVPLDYMHLVLLGVQKRMISLWMKGDLKYRFSSNIVSNISANLLHFRNSMPKEFCRKPRSLSDYKQWKATEFRQFLLYTGLLALFNIVPKAIYDNFVTLSVALTYLLSPNLVKYVEYLDYVEKLLVNFVFNFKELYGETQIVYNVHSLIHLVQDAKKFGALDNISAFPFENQLRIIKKMVRRPQNPIAQIVCPMAEKANAINNINNVLKGTAYKKNIYKKKQTSRPVPECLNQFFYQQYRQCKENNKFASTAQGDNCFEISGNPSVLLNILLNEDNKAIVVYDTFKELVGNLLQCLWTEILFQFHFFTNKLILLMFYFFLCLFERYK
ncbi:uncharacterized protein LOC136074237 [Hydra vulgaris]|uniref:Uncharacterized protein LOC136074237 n=1 Tax=Hydra vulgaris TaxID=6087 RepID=A0ABM4B1F6_HYDVU